MDHRPFVPPARPLVFIVDNQDETRALYALALSAMGFDVITMRDDAEAFNLSPEKHPDIIVTEWASRHRDGWEVLRLLKGDPRTRDIPVVIVTPHNQKSARELAAREGFAAFFVEPCLPDKLATELRRVLEQTARHEHAAIGT